MTAGIIYDASFGHAEITPTAMAKTTAGGVILYAGCNDPKKNATKAEVQALLAAGYQIGLVIENIATDAIGGAAVGTAQGKAIVAAAKGLDYDWQSCVLFGGYDTDSHAGDWPQLLAYEKAFAAQVPVPGYYGDSDSIDYLHDHGSAGWIFWQSDSRSFSPRNPTPNAHLLQLFNDPRAHGLPVDVDLVQRTPLRLMGEDMPLSDADVNNIWNGPSSRITLDDGKTTWTASHVLKRAYTEADAAGTAAAAAGAAAAATANQVATLEATVTALQATVAALQPSAALGGTATVQIDLSAK